MKKLTFLTTLRKNGTDTTFSKNNVRKELGRIVDIIVRGYSPEKIILFGSWAKGGARQDSDIDLVLIKSTKHNPWERAKEVDRIIDHKVAIDILIYTPEEMQQRLSMNDYFVKQLNKYGKVIYNG